MQPTDRLVATVPPARRRPVGARRAGYVVSIAVNVVLWYLVVVRPGWSVVPFLTDGFGRLVPLFTVSVVATIALNAIWCVHDPRWLTALGNAITAGIGVAIGVLTWRVFPFDFEASTVPWALLVRMLIALAIAGCAVGALASTVLFLAAAARPDDRSPR